MVHIFFSAVVQDVVKYVANTNPGGGFTLTMTVIADLEYSCVERVGEEDKNGKNYNKYVVIN